MPYLSVLFETAWHASLIPLGNDATFFAMKSFGGYDMRLALAMAIIGASAGQLFNWGVGMLFLTLKNSGNMAFRDSWYRALHALFNSYGILALLLCWAPLLNLLVVTAAFAGARPKIALPLVILGEAAYYGYYLF